MTYKTYLGDSVYADFDGYHIVLTTENGGMFSNKICLEPSVYEALVAYTKRLYLQWDEDRAHSMTGGIITND